MVLICIKFILQLALFAAFTHVLLACTTIHAKVSHDGNGPHDGVTIIGRSMEIGVRALLRKWDIVVIPRQSHKFRSFFTLLSSNFLNTTSNSVGFVAINAPVTLTKKAISYVNVAVEGQNEYGVTISSQTLQMSRYQTWPPPPSTGNSNNSDATSGPYQLSFLDMVPYILGSFTNADDAIHALRTEVIVTAPEFVKEGSGLRQHWTIDDARGSHYVVEYLDGQLVTHKSALGVMTNDPSFSWHVRNLNYYANVQAAIPTVPNGLQKDIPTNVYPLPFDSKVPLPKSHGTGLQGLPGDLSPPARFVRSFYLRGLAQMNEPPTTLTEGLALVTNLLDAVAIPFGTVAPAKKKGSYKKDETCKDDQGFTIEDIYTDVELQQWCVLKVPSLGLLFYRDYVNSAWKVIKLRELDFSQGAPIQSTKVYNASEPFALPTSLKVFE